MNKKIWNKVSRFWLPVWHTTAEFKKIKWLPFTYCIKFKQPSFSSVPSLLSTIFLLIHKAQLCSRCHMELSSSPVVVTSEVIPLGLPWFIVFPSSKGMEFPLEYPPLSKKKKKNFTFLEFMSTSLCYRLLFYVNKYY